MTLETSPGPYVMYGDDPGGLAAPFPSGRNPELGPAVIWGGGLMLDPRVGFLPGSAAGTAILGWGGTDFLVTKQIPSQLQTNNIAVAQVPVNGVAMTLVSASGAGITIGQAITNKLTGAAVTGALVIDGAPTPIKFGFGTSTTIQAYDPRNTVSRTVRVSSAGNDTGGTVVIRGFDLYSYPMSETQSLTNGGATAGKKAFKYVTSVTPISPLSGSNLSVGTGDIYGFPLRSDSFALTFIFWNGILATASTGYTAAVATDPNTAILGDVRGTYNVQSASDGTKELVMGVTVPPWNLSPAAVSSIANQLHYTGLFGVPQFTS